MAIAHGTQAKLGIEVLPTFGDPTNAYTVVPMVTENIIPTFTTIPNEVLMGKAGRTPGQQGNLGITGDIMTDLHYHLSGLIEVAMGSKTGTSPDATYALRDDLDQGVAMAVKRGLDGTDYFYKGKVNVMTIAGAVAAAVTAKYTSNFTRYDAESVTVPNFTDFSGSRVLFSDLEFKISPIGGSPSLPTIPISSFELVLTNNLQIDGYASKQSSGANAKEILEPIRNGRRDVSFKFSVARVDSSIPGLSNLFDAQENGDPLEAKLVFTEPGSSGKTITIDLPNLMIVSGGMPNVSGPVVLPVEFVCTAFRKTTSPEQEEFTITMDF